MESSEPPPEMSLLQRIRNTWEFSNLMQYIFIFGKAVKIDEDFSIDVGPSIMSNHPTLPSSVLHIHHLPFLLSLTPLLRFLVFLNDGKDVFSNPFVEGLFVCVPALLNRIQEVSIFRQGHGDAFPCSSGKAIAFNCLLDLMIHRCILFIVILRVLEIFRFPSLTRSCRCLGFLRVGFRFWGRGRR